MTHVSYTGLRQILSGYPDEAVDGRGKPEALRLRIPIYPPMYSNAKPPTDSDLKPPGVPI
jgi:hypothetical protein